MNSLVETSRGPFAVEDVGQGQPIVLVHGFPLDHTMWSHQIAALSAAFRVVAVDLRGFGRSPARDTTVSMADFADDVAAIIEHHQLGPVVFCGLSMGGYIAWEFQRRHRALLRALILCDTRAVADPPEAAKARRVTAERVLKEGPAFLADTMLPRLFGEKTALTQPEIVEATRRVIETANPIGVAAASRGMADRHDFSGELPSIAIPTLVIVGEQDVISPAEEMTAIAHRMPQAQLRVIPGVGHMAPLEAPAAVNEAIREFVGSL